MESLITTALIILGILILIYFCIVFNSLITLKNNIRKSWANIDVLLKQRHDELPNLVETVKGYMKHEKSLLLDITNARVRFSDAKSMSDKAKASGIISQQLKSLFAVSENYPSLRANENFIKLQARITVLEDNIADRREFFNDSVNLYNIKINSLPDMLIANILSYKPEEMFKIQDEEKISVKVNMH